MRAKLEKFYLKLPKDIVDVDENEEYNRETRRQLKKIKKVEAKIKYILKDEARHQILRECINNKYKGISNKLDTISEIIDSINENNFEQSMIYMLKEFYNDKAFEEYVLSEEYDKNLENFVCSNITKKESKDENMKNDKEEMNKYIVNIEEKNGFYNIYPLLKVKKEELIEVEESEYPDYGNVNIYPWREFSNKNYDRISPLWICRFNQSQLEEIQNKTKGTQNITRFKIDGDELIKNKSIYTINDEEIYEIADLVEHNGTLEKAIYNEKIEIKNEIIFKKFYIKDENYIYGPFQYTEDKQGYYYIDKEKSGYIIQKYPIQENKLYLNIKEVEIPYDYNRNYITLVNLNDKENLVSETIDIISDEELLNNLKEKINTKNINYSRRDTQEIRNNIECIIDNSLSEERRNRIKRLIENTEITEDFIENDLIDIIEPLLEDDEFKHIFAKNILLEPENLRKLQSIEIVQFSIDNKRKELNNLKEDLEIEKKKLEQLKLEENDIKNKNMEELIENNQNEINDLTSKKEEIKKNIEELKIKYKEYKNLDDLTKKIKEYQEKAKQAQDDYNVFTRKNEEMKDKVKKIEKNIKEKLENVINQYSDITFDGIIANEMLESAANWNKKKQMEDFKKSIMNKEKIEEVVGVKSFKDDNIIDYIYDKIKLNRNYTKNDIINTMICLTQGFLTVFAGEPGVGKTSICNILAKTLGLSNRNANYNRFVEVSVEKGWTSKRDLIGYYNPLTKSFDKNNKSLFRTFNILNQEYIEEINDFPYYVLLDEANLSSMEHYWGDFMNVCDLDKEIRKINLGEDYIYNIPQTLRFLATINYDHTTETLSPRLIDRAWIILLERDNLEIDNYDVYYEEEEEVANCMIMFEDIKNCFSYTSCESSDEESSNQMYTELYKIYRIFEENSISISQRIKKMIKMYLKVGCNLFDDTDSTPCEFVALDYAIAQKLLPKINGYGPDYEKFLNDINDMFDKNNMMKCTRIISNIIKKGNANMQYYQFFF